MNWAVDLNQKFMPFLRVAGPSFVSAVIISLSYSLCHYVCLFVCLLCDKYSYIIVLSPSHNVDFLSSVMQWRTEYSIAFINISVLTDQSRIDVTKSDIEMNIRCTILYTEKIYHWEQSLCSTTDISHNKRNEEIPRIEELLPSHYAELSLLFSEKILPLLNYLQNKKLQKIAKYFTYPCEAANHIGLFNANEECHWAGQQ